MLLRHRRKAMPLRRSVAIEGPSMHAHVAITTRNQPRKRPPVEPSTVQSSSQRPPAPARRRARPASDHDCEPGARRTVRGWRARGPVAWTDSRGHANQASRPSGHGEADPPPVVGTVADTPWAPARGVIRFGWSHLTHRAGSARSSSSPCSRPAAVPGHPHRTGCGIALAALEDRIAARPAQGRIAQRLAQRRGFGPSGE